MPRNIIDVTDLTVEEIDPSTRTRLSFESAMLAS